MITNLQNENESGFVSEDPIIQKYLNGQIVQFPLLTSQYCDQLHSQLQQFKIFEEVKQNNPQIKVDPIINLDIGQLLISSPNFMNILQSIVQKSSEILQRNNFKYLQTCGLDLNDFLGFFIDYTEKDNHIHYHRDESFLTLNICLKHPGQDNGGNVTFAQLNKEISIHIQQGYVIAHLGRILHKSEPFKAGENRSVLIIYCLLGHHGQNYDFYKKKYIPYLSLKHSFGKNIQFDVPNLPICCDKADEQLEFNNVFSNNIIKLILSYLTFKEIVKVSSVSLKWYRIIRKIPENIIQKPSRKETKEKFIQYNDFFQQNDIKIVKPSNNTEREIICLHIGGSGIRVGHEIWRLLSYNTGFRDHPSNVFYRELDAGQGETTFIPRAIFVDSNQEEVDYRHILANNLQEINLLFDQKKKGKYLYDVNNFLAMQNLDENYGYQQIFSSSEIDVQNTLDIIRKSLESCNHLQGIILTHSLEGSFGSSLASVLTEQLKYSLGLNKKTTTNFAIFPNELTQFRTYLQPKSILSPYNSLLCSSQLVEYSDIIFSFCNNAIDNFLRKEGWDYPLIPDFNQVLAFQFLQMTYNFMNDSSLNTDLSEIVTNHIPLPRLQTLSSNSYPFSQTNQKFSTGEITYNTFENLFVNCNYKFGKYMAVSLNYTGDVIPKDVMAAVGSIKTKRTIQFVDWAPTGFKCGINYSSLEYPYYYKFIKKLRNCNLVANNSALGSLYDKIIFHSEKMLKKNALLSHFNKEDLEESMDNLLNLVADYQECEVEENDQ